jgi:hypothetical protein
MLKGEQPFERADASTGDDDVMGHIDSVVHAPASCIGSPMQEAS